MLPSPVHFALGFHCHQPVGNFEEVFERNYRSAYQPLLNTMLQHSSIPFSLHITGPLLEWLNAAHPSYLDKVADQARQERIEIKGGPFYEAILPIIHSCDRAAQLNRMQTYLEQRIGVRPQGAWIPERVWEPQLARDLAEAGLQYTVLDDTQFEAAAVQPAIDAAYYTTEDQGYGVDLFPISRRLRYLIPFSEPSATRDFLREIFVEHQRQRRLGAISPDAPPPLVLCEDDGEKFGAWPQTYEHVYQQRWLDRFLALLQECVDQGWLKLTTPSAYRSLYPPRRLVYLAAGSYPEMQEWSQGNFRNFLSRYAEANRLHKRMLTTSRRCREHLSDIDRASANDAPAGDVPVASIAAAYECALKAQCNDAYWHGVFGGLYLPHLRQAIYANLIHTESLLPPGPPLSFYDADYDGHVDVQLQSRSLMALVAPQRGGSLWALDHLPTQAALLDTLRRRREPEHDALENGAPATSKPKRGRAVSIHDEVRVKEPGLHRLLRIDPFPRDAFLDHFYPKAFRRQDLQDASIVDLGDFATGSYEVLPNHAEDKQQMPLVQLRRVGLVAGWNVALSKCLQLEDDRLRMTYRMEILHSALRPSRPADVYFAPELTVNLLGGSAPGYCVLIDGVKPTAYALGDEGTHVGAESVTLIDGTRNLSVALCWEAYTSRHDDPADADAPPGDWIFPPSGTAFQQTTTATLHRHGVWTVSLSEDGFEKVFQGTALIPAWPLSLRTGEILDARIVLTVRALP
ncbi:MAG: DUF1926 domain-containing protein [Actinobacteria bacterium]|nr:DUF1926 domain-containing protein [Actinomycetota bacterium]